MSNNMMFQERLSKLFDTCPILSLTKNSKNKFISKINSQCKSENQQLFILDFYKYLSYKNENEFIVDFDDVWKWIGYTRKDTAKDLLKKYYQENIHYTTDKNNGSHKEIILLTTKTFKSFCLNAKSQKAKEIHSYFLQLENVISQCIAEEPLSCDINTPEFLTSQKIKTENELEKQEKLLKEYTNINNIVYVIRVKSYPNGKFIVKIGESRCGVKRRYNDHKFSYEECVLLDCFTVNNCKDFECFLHSHEMISSSRVRDLEGHEKERELFLIGYKLSYNELLDIINKNINTFNTNSDKIKLENQIHFLESKIQLLEKEKEEENDYHISMKNVDTSNLDMKSLQYFIETNNKLFNKIKNMEEKIQYMDNKIQILEENINNSENTTQQKFDKLITTTIAEPKTTFTGSPISTLGPRLQQLDPETLELIKVYDTVSDCMKDYPAIKRPSINKAIVENTIYHGFRWMFVDRELDPTIVSDKIEPTRKITTPLSGYVAKINSTQTEIINVCIDRKTAALQDGYSPSSLDFCINKDKLINGAYYKNYNIVSQELKDKFEEKIGHHVLLYHSGVGKYDKEHKLVQIFACKYDCIRNQQMSDKSLAKVLDKDLLYHDHYYKSIGHKLVV